MLLLKHKFVFFLPFFCLFIFDNNYNVLGTTTETARSLEDEYDEYVSNLISNFTLDEKCSQLVVDAQSVPRLNVPKYHWRNNILHGLVDNGVSTMFPQAIGLGATWDYKLMKKAALLWGDEQRAKHNSKVYAEGSNGDSPMNFGLDLWGPNINMFIHPLWGRGQETFGEDPYLTGKLAVQIVKGLQTSVDGIVKTICTPKHFVAYNIDNPEVRLNIYEQISNQQLQEYYFPAFKYVVQAGAKSIMCSYNGVGKYPMCMSPMLQKVLRDDFGFKGYVVTDSGALDFMVTQFHRYKTYEQVAMHAIKAGVDLNSGTVLNKPLCNAVKSNMVDEQYLDKALKRVFKARMEMGTLQFSTATKAKDPFSYLNEKEHVNTPEHQMVALEAARKSLVLLKNANNLLPLDEKTFKTIAAFGPAANDTIRLVGNYYGCSFGTYGPILEECNIKPPLQGITEAFPNSNILFDQGTAQEDPNEKNDYKKSIEIAKKSDVVILFMGLKTCFPNVESGKHCESEGKDRNDLRLPENQHNFIKAIKANTGKPVILVLSTGGPVSLFWEAQYIDAIIVSWYGGSFAAQAIGDLVKGAFSPSGKLPVSFPTNMTQVAAKFGLDLLDPPFGRTYRYFNSTPLYQFGFGLSYSKFEISNTKLLFDQSKICFDITNHGGNNYHANSNKGDSQVVMVFSSYQSKKTERNIPKMQLVGFENFDNLKRSKQSSNHCIEFDKEAMKLVGQDGKLSLQFGAYDIYVGFSPPNKLGYFVDEQSIMQQKPIKLSLMIQNDEMVAIK